MKKLLLVLSIVSLLLSCDDAGMENQDNSQETSQIELKEPIGITNVRHTRNGNDFTIFWDKPSEGLNKIALDIYVKYDNNPVLVIDRKDFVNPNYSTIDEPLTTEYSFSYTVSTTATVKRMQVHLRAWLDPKVYKQPVDPVTDYYIDL
jgi:hypothetical protein